MLASLDGVRVSGIAPETLARLAQQARLQKISAATGSGVHEIIAHPPGLGFDRLPMPDPGDLFFDFEGDPMHPGGLEYLCGVLWQGEDGDARRRARTGSSWAAVPRVLGARPRPGEGGIRGADEHS